MTLNPTHPHRIVLMEEFICHAVTLPFSLEGHRRWTWFYMAANRSPGPRPDGKPLPDLPPEGFDLILDGQFLTAGWPTFPERLG